MKTVTLIQGSLLFYTKVVFPTAKTITFTPLVRNEVIRVAVIRVKQVWNVLLLSSRVTEL